MRGRVSARVAARQINLRSRAKAENHVAVRQRLFPLLAIVLTCALRGATPPANPFADPPPAGPAAELRTSEALALGVIEGVTEFLPVSSTGHLILARDLLRLNSEQPFFDSVGDPLWYRRPSSHGPGQLLTRSIAIDAYIYVIQFGAAAAVALVCWPQLLSMLRGLFGRDPAGLRLLINVMVAFLPAAVLGLLIHDWIDENLFSTGAVIFAQIAGAILMFYVEYWYGRRYLAGVRPTVEELNPVSAAFIGLLQCVAMWPGTSRPMMAIVGGYFAGLDPRRAAEFSFLLGFVTLCAASLYKTYTSGSAIVQVFGWPHVLLGAAVAAITAALCVRLFVHLLVRHGLNGFAWYRIILGLALFMYF
jgi:undecaprenyl-diphosphatase